MSTPPETIDVEVVRDTAGPQDAGSPPPRTPGAPIHPLSAILLLVFDNLWTIPEFVVIDWIVTIPLSFVSVFVPTFFIQKTLKRDSAGRAFVFALLLGVLAAVPTSLTGTPVGLAILAWTGISKLVGSPLSKPK